MRNQPIGSTVGYGPLAWKYCCSLASRNPLVAKLTERKQLLRRYSHDGIMMPAAARLRTFRETASNMERFMASTTQRPSTLQLTIILGCLAAFGPLST
jgi:hypothetical protein